MRAPPIPLLGAALLAAAFAAPGTLFAASAPSIESKSGLPKVAGLPQGNAVVGAVETGARDAAKRGLSVLKGTGNEVSEVTEKGRRSKAPRPTQAAASTAATAAVDIRDFAYQPQTITVSVGDAVTWTNSDQAPHDADAFDGSFDTPVLDEGESASVTFDEAGSFEYFCSVHPPEDFPDFTGTVVVEASDGPASGSGGGDTPASSDTGAGSGGGASTGPADDSAEGLGGTRSERATGSARPGSQLASTGQELLPLSILGTGLVLLGLLMRRRRTAA